MIELRPLLLPMTGPHRVADEEEIFVGARVMGAVIVDFLTRPRGLAECSQGGPP